MSDAVAARCGSLSPSAREDMKELCVRLLDSLLFAARRADLVAARELVRAFAECRTHGSATELGLLVELLKSTLGWLDGDAQAAHVHSNHALRVGRDLQASMPAQYFTCLPTIKYVEAMADLSVGNVREAANLFADAVALGRIRERYDIEVSALCGISLTAAIKGDFRSSMGTAEVVAKHVDLLQLEQLPALSFAHYAQLLCLGAQNGYFTAPEPIGTVDDSQSGSSWQQIRALARGVSLLYRKEPQQAFDEAEGILKEGSRGFSAVEWVAQYIYADALLMLGKPEHALRSLERVHDFSDEHFWCVAALRARCYIALGAPRTALECTEKCMSAWSTHARRSYSDVLFARACALEMQAKESAADSAYILGLKSCLTGGSLGALRVLPHAPMDHLLRRAKAVQPELIVNVLDPDIRIGLSKAPNPLILRLTRRELVVLRLLSTQLTVHEIAARLQLSKNTIKTQVRAIYKKLEVSSREEAVSVLEA